MRALILLLTGSLGCGASWPATKYEGPGKQYCRAVAKAYDASSGAQLAVGIGLTISAAVLVVLGPAMGPDTAPGANWGERNRNAVTTAVGGLIAIPAALLFARSRVGSSASARAAQNLSPRVFDDDAMEHCLEIRGEAIVARKDIANLAQKLVQDFRKEYLLRKELWEAARRDSEKKKEEFENEKNKPTKSEERIQQLEQEVHKLDAFTKSKKIEVEVIQKEVERLFGSETILE